MKSFGLTSEQVFMDWESLVKSSKFAILVQLLILATWLCDECRLSLCLSVCLSICLSIWLSVYVSVCLCMCLSVYLSIWLSIWLSVCLYLCLFLCLSVCMYVYMYVCMYVCVAGSTATTRLADAALVCVQDQMHKEVSVQLAMLGYSILQENPLAVTETDCKEVARVCQEMSTLFSLCHVLRYSPHNRLIKKLISDGAIGSLKNISHTEPVGFYHFAHSFVRGNWRSEAESCSAMTSNCCHDVDLIRHWNAPRKCTRCT